MANKTQLNEKKLMLLLMLGIVIYACSQGGKQSADSQSAQTTAAQPSDYDPKRGLGKFDKVDVGNTLDAALAQEGKLIADVKCASCHKYTSERLVGPGWSGVTKKHQPAWIMNFITNPDPMIDKDPELQAQLEICLVRMPNQNLSDEDARKILEFMRENDGVN
ncbi:c-type cytochrome [Parapedobacter koreensis]|uniref:Cytochrome c n=1 Tax=Parapedobacter koreensis TaxID=332977 RepID=A0A1H7RL10_9SPHI|nr:cytochrome c [Parapedobacter koreensis]SEL60087.1 Cytochrome c [Parapedobacter koreensis]